MTSERDRVDGPPPEAADTSADRPRPTLPVPSLTATIYPPDGPGELELGRVVVDGYTPPEPARDRASHRCSRCVSVGLGGEGHISRSRHCPSRAAL